MLVPTKPNECWSVDFMSDPLADGRRFRVLNVVDDFSRACVGQLVDTSISGVRVAQFLTELCRPLPKTIVCDNVLCPVVKRLLTRAKPLLATGQQTSLFAPQLQATFRTNWMSSRP